MANRLAQPVLQTDTAKNPSGSGSVGVASAQLVAANPDRVEITICNDHATNVVYLSLGGTAAVGSGIRINAAGGSYTTAAYTGAINAIASGATTTVTISEV